MYNFNTVYDLKRQSIFRVVQLSQLTLEHFYRPLEDPQ